MQLTTGELRKQLHRAAHTLLAATAAVMDTASAANKDWEINGSGFFYTESERISVYEETIYVKKSLRNGDIISIKRTHDILTGASPSGEAKPSAAQTFTTASGSNITTKAGSAPLGKFEDIRTAFNVAFDKRLSSSVTSIWTANFSYEYDYTSSGAGLQLSRDIFDKQATLNGGVNANYDIVRPRGGVPTGMKSSLDPARYESDQKLTYDALAGLALVVDKNSLATATYMFGSSRGYLNDPYKLVSRLNLDGTASGSSQFEKRPETRQYKSVHVRLIHSRTGKSALGDVTDSAYRFYMDDWGIQSHTLDLRYRHDFEGRDAKKNKEYLQAHVRMYMQSAANFYVYGLPVLQPDPAYASADYRLAALRTATAGLLWGRELVKDLTLTVRGEYLYQWYVKTSLTPLGAILTQASLYYQF